MAVDVKTFIKQYLIGPYAVGETPDALQISFKNSGGDALDLTGYSLGFSIIRLDGDDPGGLAAGVSSLSDAANGVTQYQWDADDFLTEGHYRGVMWVTNGSIRRASEIFEWYVRDTGTTSPV